MPLNINASRYLNGKKAEESKDRFFGGITKSPKPRGAAAEVYKQVPDVARQEGLWTAVGILEMSRNQIPLKITVNPKEREIEYVEVDREAIKNTERP
jgi:hypothetical protein